MNDYKDVRRIVLKKLNTSPAMTTTNIARKTHISIKKVKKALKYLRKHGKASYIYKKYWTNTSEE